MKKTLFTLIISLFLAQTVFIAPAAAFSDVTNEHRYFNDIQYLENTGIAQETEFRPNAPMSREMFAKWLLKSNGFMGENYRPQTRRRFFDLRMSSECAPYIYKLADLGTLNFGEEKIVRFRPEAAITRAEALEWMFMVEGVPAPKIFDPAQFGAEDIDSDSRIAPLFDKAIKLGILRPGKMHPGNSISRGEAAHFLKTVKNQTPTLTVTIVPSVDSDIIRNPKFDILIAAWNRIFQTYLHSDTANRDNLLYGAIEGMVDELGDSHSDFERPSDSKTIDSLSGEIEGIGAVIQMRDDEPIIVAPIVNSPAERAGLRGGDVITFVDDAPVRGMRLDAVVQRIKGQRGTQVRLIIRRGTETVSYTITREVIRIVSVSERRTNDNVSIITLSNFGQNSYQELGNIIASYQERRPIGIVLDLRNNPGGFLDTAIQIAGFFIQNGRNVVKIRYPNREEIMASSGNASLASFSEKTAVITNGGSASASEILAGALQDYGIAKIIGEKTYGKGSVQELSDFTDSSTLKLTVAEWLTPNGRSIENNGIVPDIEIPMTDADRQAGRDPQMDRALEEVRR